MSKIAKIKKYIIPTPKIFLISNFTIFSIQISHVTKIKNLAYYVKWFLNIKYLLFNM